MNNVFVSVASGKWKSVTPWDASTTVNVLRGRAGSEGLSEVDKQTLF